MQTRNRVLDDLAKVAGGAVSALAGIKGEVDALIHQQLERLMAQMDAVPRDEFEVVKALASKARTEQEKLEKCLTRLEARLSENAPHKTARKADKTATAKDKSAARKKPAAKVATKATATRKAKAATKTRKKAAAKTAPQRKAARQKKSRQG